MNNSIVKIMVISLALFSGGVVSAASLNGVKFVKIAPQDSRALIKGTDGKLLVIKPGDTVAENVTVKEIATGRIVLEEMTANGLETIIVRMTNDTTRIERMRKQPNTPAPVLPVHTGTAHVKDVR
jgi:hypothetical protein